VSVGVVKVIKTIVIKIVKTVKTVGSWSCMHVEVRICCCCGVAWRGVAWRGVAETYVGCSEQKITKIKSAFVG
jgi:hypothetical protein